MSKLKPASPPGKSGARLGGDDLQHLVAWHWCLRMLTPANNIVAVSLEADGQGNLDDVTVEFGDGRHHYVQVKASVSADGQVNSRWLMYRRKQSAESLIEKLYESWDALGRPGDGIELLTSRPLDPDEPLLRGLDRNNSIGRALRRGGDEKLNEARAVLAGHLNCAEEDLCSFFDALTIRVGQTECELRSRIGDVAMGAGVRNDLSAVLASVGWVRDWVKNTKDPIGADEVMEAVDQLGLRVEPPRALVVIQGIESVPSEGAIETLHWTNRFRGNSPETRRGLVNPDDWNGALADDLAEMKSRLLAGSHRRILLRGALRLPCWFGVGATFRQVAGFDIAMEYHGKLWKADSATLALPAVEVRVDEARGEGRTVVVVAISTDATGDVRVALVNDRIGRLVTLGLPGGPSPSAISGPTDAMAAAVAIREWVRKNVHQVDLDLVLMTPAPFAMFLGHVWDRIAPTTIHEDLVSGYEAAFHFRNEIN